MNFSVLILGSDANAYYMARCYHELYNKKVDMISKAPIAVTMYSNIINFIEVPKIYSNDVFAETLNKYAEGNSFEKIILIGTNDKYVRLIVENKSKLNNVFVHNYPSVEIMDTLLLKDKFYNAFHSELDLPKTLVYSCKEKPEIEDNFTYPVILKAGNGIEYNKHAFEGMSKVYKIQSFQSLLTIVKQIENSGYEDNLIIQEFIPGDDCALYDAVFYCGKDKKVKLMTFAQIGLQERTNTGVGNCTILVNGFDEHALERQTDKDNMDLVNSLKEFLEKIGYQGFAEFDLKYDIRDGKYKIFEINPRQARSSYYLTACGHNLVKYLVDDLIYNKIDSTANPKTEAIFMKNKMVLSFVPKIVINKYVTSAPLLNEINAQIAKGNFTNPLKYNKDKNLKRKFYLFMRDINYIIKYGKLSW